MFFNFDEHCRLNCVLAQFGEMSVIGCLLYKVSCHIEEETPGHWLFCKQANAVQTSKSGGQNYPQNYSGGGEGHTKINDPMP